MRIPRMDYRSIGTAGFLVLLTACSDSSPQRQALTAGEQALQAQQYDRAQRDADWVVASGVAADAAEANYLRGEAIEQRPKPDPAAAKADLAQARQDYCTALGEKPDPALQARLHSQLGNVAYFQEDYAVALQQWTIAYHQLDQPVWKQWVLYRMGICQQRLGRFADADRTFELVQGEYPGTEVARRAQARQGVHGFYVQVGAFTDAGDAQKAAYTIGAVGSIPEETDQRGLKVVRTAGVPSYAQAAALKNRLATQYPDAAIMP